MSSLGPFGRAAGKFAFTFVVGAVCAASFASGAAATTNAVWGQGVRGPLPAGARSGSLSAVSCSAPGACSAVGTVTDASGNQQALLLSESGGGWHPQAATLPASAGSTPQATLDAVSCASAGVCTAVGTYADTAGNTQGLIVSETAGSWSPAVMAPLPSGAQSGNPGVSLASVSCPTASTCVGVGSYRTAAGSQTGLLETQNSDGFTAQDVVLPDSITSSSGSNLTSVSCVASGECMAVGGYATSRFKRAMVVNRRSGRWQPAVAAPVPGATTTTSNSALDSASCSSSGSCTAVGDYDGAAGSGPEQPLVVAEAVGGSPQSVSVPQVAAAVAPSIASSVSCAGPEGCVAVGTTGQNRPTTCCEAVGSGLLLSQSSGSWTQSVAMMPADAASPPASNDTFFPLPVLSSVSCPPGGGCSGGGTYEPAREVAVFTYGNAPLLINRSGTAWGSGFAPVLPADAASGPLPTPYGLSGPSDVIDAVSCATAGTCAAVGSYTDASGNGQPLLVTSTPGSAPSSLTVQAPQAASAMSPIAGASVTGMLSSEAGPTGTISFHVFGPSDAPPTDCTSGGAPAGTTSVLGVGSYHTSAGITPPRAGDYWWYGAYSGDDNAQASRSACGAGMPETVAAARSVPPRVVVKPTKPAICSRPTGRLTATAIGPIALGMTRVTANKRLTHHTGTATTERFCLIGGGATHVLYASRRLLSKLPVKTRRRLVGRMVLVLTASPRYAIGKVKIGTSQQRALRTLTTGHRHRVDNTSWYLSRVRGSERVIKVQRGAVTEIGVGNPMVLTRAGWRAVLRDF